MFRTLPFLILLLLATGPTLAADAPTAEPAAPQFSGDDLDIEAVALARPASRPDDARARSMGSLAGEDDIPTPGPRAFDQAEAQRLEIAEQEALFGSLQSTMTSQKMGSDEAGGDDVVIFEIDEADGSIAQEYAYDIDIAENGVIFVAVEVYKAVSNSEIQIWRSEDGGSTWEQWGVRMNASNLIRYRKPSLHIAEGMADRLYLAYEYRNDANDVTVNVASSPLNVGSAVWTVRTAFSAGGIDFHRPDITSDAIVTANYRVYVVAEENDHSSNDIWFNVSDDFNATWGAEYEIGTLGGNTTDYYKPKVWAASAGMVHVVWYRATYSDESVDDSIRYRHAENKAQFGIADWGVVEYITSSFDGFNDYDPAITNTFGGSLTVLNFTRVPDGGGQIDNVIRESPDWGFSWDPLDETTLDVVSRPHILTLPTGDMRAWGSWFWPEQAYGFMSSDIMDPYTWAPSVMLSDEMYAGDHVVHQAMADYDETRGNRLGMVWSMRDGGVPDVLYFDAEWRRDPGYPNMESNFPVPLTAAPATPPALADVDADNRGEEIVFGTTDGLVHVYQKDGTPLAGFPVDTGEDISNESLAVGDLDGDGTVEIVVGTNRGMVHAYDNAGNMLAGFPRDLGTVAPAYVSIGTVSKLLARDIVATSGKEIHLLKFDGSEHDYAPWPILNPEPFKSAAAIGDVDLDGTAELAIAAGDKVRLYHHDTTQSFLRTIAGSDLSETPSIGDIDMADPELEIAVPTDHGQVWVFQHVGANMAGWPFDTGQVSPINEIALSGIGPFSNDLYFSQRNWTVHARAADGAGIFGWPQSTTPGWFLKGGPIVDRVAPALGNVLIGDRGKAARAFDSSGALLPGWPKFVNDVIQVSPASGDIDRDFDMEVVFLSSSELIVVDTNSDPIFLEGNRWPMYGHDAQRTSCNDCEMDAVTAIPGTVASRVSFAPPSPNPAPGRTQFSYTLPSHASVRLEIFDARGRRVRRLLREEQGAGTHEIGWNGKDDSGRRVSRGQYFGRLMVQGEGLNEQQARKIILID